jgi:hypothetical protein
MAMRWVHPSRSIKAFSPVHMSCDPPPCTMTQAHVQEYCNWGSLNLERDLYVRVGRYSNYIYIQQFCEVHRFYMGIIGDTFAFNICL